MVSEKSASSLLFPIVFCGDCSRVRLTSNGKIRTCLFSQLDHDLYGLLRRGATDEELPCFIEAIIQKEEARHHIGEPRVLKPSEAFPRGMSRRLHSTQLEMFKLRSIGQEMLAAVRSAAESAQIRDCEELS
jgi:molybdenum cofactor biosynthesis enzyme MoaA